MKIYFINCLILILTVQNCLAIPVSDTDSTDKEQLNEHNKLFELTLNKFVAFNADLGKVCNEYRSMTFKELEKNNDLKDRELMEREHEKFVKSLEKLEEATTTDDKLMHIAKLQREIISSVKHLEDPDADEETKNLIEKYHVKGFFEKLYAFYFEFYEGFENAFNEYISELNETQKEEQKELLNWFKDFDQETKWLPKTEKFMEFFSIFYDE
uniref:Gmfb8d n=1 Tax=Glossina morsitans morsitans TaxID=37546 RepID=D3TRD5_GLOMM